MNYDLYVVVLDSGDEKALEEVSANSLSMEQLALDLPDARAVNDKAWSYGIPPLLSEPSDEAT